MVNGPSDVDPAKMTQLKSRGEIRHPGVCALCGSGNCDEGYLDTGVYYDYEGHVYICILCVNSEILPQIGAIPYAEAEYIKLERQKDATTILDLEKKLAETQEKYRELAVAIDVIRRGSDLSLDPAPVSPAKDGSEESPADDGNTGQSVKDSTVGEPESPKPVKGKRPNDTGKSSAGDDTKDTFGL